MRRAFAATLAVAFVLAGATSAAAHTSLVSSSPAPGANVESPATVSLTFDDTLLQLGDDVVVNDAQGVNRVAGDPYFPRPDTIQADIDGTLEPGDYVVAWRIVAEDGHPIQGTIPFTVVGDASSVSTAAPAPTAAAATATSGGVPWMLVVGVLGAFAVVGVIVFVARPRRSRD